MEAKNIKNFKQIKEKLLKAVRGNAYDLTRFGQLAWTNNHKPDIFLLGKTVKHHPNTPIAFCKGCGSIIYLNIERAIRILGICGSNKQESLECTSQYIILSVCMCCYKNFLTAKSGIEKLLELDEQDEVELNEKEKGRLRATRIVMRNIDSAKVGKVNGINFIK